MVKFLKVAIEIDAKRPKVKVWFPGRIVKVGKDHITDREFKGTGPVALGSAEDPVSFDFFDSSTSTSHDDDVSDDEFENDKGLAEPPSTYVLDWDNLLNDLAIMFFPNRKT